MCLSKIEWAACIVYYDDPKSLTNLLYSLEKQTLKPSLVVIADNNSRQKFKLKDYSFPITLIEKETNTGFAGGANVAIRFAIQKEFTNLILLSQDVILESESAEKLMLQINISGGIVFPTMMDRNSNRVFSKGGKVSKFWGSIKLSTKVNLIDADWADGSCLAFKSETYMSVNSFSEQYFMYFEDVDFCIRAKQKGFKLTHVSTIASQTPKGPNPELRSRNSVLLARKSESTLFKLSVTIRNILGAAVLFARFRFKDSTNRFIGIYEGWKLKID